MLRNCMKKAGTLAVLVFIAVTANRGESVYASEVYYVSATGLDSNVGTKAAPWRTIQKAADTATAGSTVYIREGTYYERISINKSGSAAGGYIVFQNYGTDSVVIDGTGTSQDNQEALIYINNKKYIKIKGLELRNNICNSTGLFPKGIEVVGYGDCLEFSNLRIHDIKNTNITKDSGANGIGVYGTNKSAAISNLIIDNVEIFNCVLGQSETLAVNGNVDGFRINDCYIHDNDNIGICVIGYEGTCPTEANDQARNGAVSNNRVVNCSSAENPTYTDLCAGGIYSDGSRDNVLCNNIVEGCDVGIEAGSEHLNKISSNVTVRNNLIYNNNTSGIGIGGYDTNTGWTINSRILNNTLYNNDINNGYRGEIDICKSYNNIIKNNIIYCNDENDIVGNYFSGTDSYNNVMDYNIYFGPGGINNIEWVWQNTAYTGFQAYKAGSGQDIHSVFADPSFAGISDNNFHIQSKSPAIDSGDPDFAEAAGEVDLDGTPRVKSGNIDSGAYEY